jgi:protein-S-isoprenylcysteine O-methyltransferase Ste14
VPPLPFDTVPARIAFDGILCVFAAGEVAIRVISSRNGGRDRELVSLIVVVAGLGLSLAGALAAATRVPAAAIPFARVPIFVVGIVIMAFGIGLRFWSVVALGRYFTVAVQVRENQPVIDSGPYRLLRHPAYAGLLCVCLGFGIALGNWLAVIVAVVPTLAAVVVRIRVEERMLLARIGAPYEDFCATRSRLLPHVW